MWTLRRFTIPTARFVRLVRKNPSEIIPNCSIMQYRMLNSKNDSNDQHLPTATYDDSPVDQWDIAISETSVSKSSDKDAWLTIQTTDGEETLKRIDLYRNIKSMSFDKVLYMVSTSGDHLDKVHLSICMKRLFNLQYHKVGEKKKEFIQFIKQDTGFKILCSLLAKKARYYDSDIALDMLRFLAAFNLEANHPAVLVYLHIVKHHINALHIDQLVKLVKILKLLMPDIYPIKTIFSNSEDFFPTTHLNNNHVEKDLAQQQIHLINIGVISLLNINRKMVTRLSWDDAVFAVGELSSALMINTVYELLAHIYSLAKDVGTLLPRECFSISHGIHVFLPKVPVNLDLDDHPGTKVAISLGEMCLDNKITDSNFLNNYHMLSVSKSLYTIKVKKYETSLYLYGNHLCKIDCSIQELTKAARQCHIANYVHNDLLDHMVFKFVRYMKNSNLKGVEPDKWMVDLVNCLAVLHDSNSLHEYDEDLCLEDFIDKVIEYSVGKGEDVLLRSLLSIISLSKPGSSGFLKFPARLQTVVEDMLIARNFNSDDDTKMHDGLTKLRRFQVLLQFYPIPEVEERLLEALKKSNKKVLDLSDPLEAIVGQKSLHSVYTKQGFFIDYLVCRQNGSFVESPYDITDTRFWQDPSYERLGIMGFSRAAFVTNKRKLKAFPQQCVDEVKKAGVIPIVMKLTKPQMGDQSQQEKLSKFKKDKHDWLSYQLQHAKKQASDTYLGIGLNF